MQMDTEQELMIEEEKREQSNEKNEEAQDNSYKRKGAITAKIDNFDLSKEILSVIKHY